MPSAALEGPGMESIVTDDDNAIANISTGNRDVPGNKMAKAMKRQKLQLTLDKGLINQPK